jgi:hypothetical protein
MQPMFDGTASAEATTLITFIGGLLMMMGFTLFVTRWNKLNGKAAGLGMFVAAATSATIAFRLDNGALVFRGWHVFATMFLLAGLHLCFNANPMWTSKTLAKKEKERAAKKAAKNK